MIKKENGQDPIFVAGGAAGRDVSYDRYSAKASLLQKGNGNDRIGSSGLQSFWQNDEHNVYCAGAGFHEAPIVKKLVADSVPPKTYAQGLEGGKGKWSSGSLVEGGFGGGGALYYRNEKFYWGAGGGYTGGSIEIHDGSSQYCKAGGGGSFSIDKNAKFDHVHAYYGKCKIEFLN